MKKPATGPRRAAIYLRISQDREMEGLAIDRQLEDCEGLAASEGWTVVKTYVDQSKTATDATKVRPDYDRMVEDYKAGAFTAVVCYDLDRFTRQPRQLEDWVDAARFRGLLLKSVAGDVDLTTENGLITAGIKVQLARAEVMRKSKRQSAAQRQRAQLGKAPKGMRPLGYAVSGEVIPDEADAVRAIYAAFTRTEAPESLRSLARALSGLQDVEGITPRPKHTHLVSIEREDARKARAVKDNQPYEFDPERIKPDGPWSPSTVLGVLRNPRYAGMSTYTPKEYQADGNRRRTWRAQILRDDAGEPIRGRWDAIVDDETWWRAQELLDDADRVTNTSGSTKRKHLGSGLYRCGAVVEIDGTVCGKKVTGAPRGYRCAGHVMRTGPAIDEYVTDRIVERLSQPDALRVEHQVEGGPGVAGINAKISELRARVRETENQFDNEEIEARDLQRIRGKAEARIQELEAERLLLGRTGALAPILGVDDPAEAFLNGTLELRRQVIDILATVTLYPQPRGRKGVDEASIDVSWKNDTTASTDPSDD
ncbi:MAG: recombinase family protein, partial [Propionibacteriaceae bacterium]|nr:recombinase family protein [Propionibacteriaceae bacterium]